MKQMIVLTLSLFIFSLSAFADSYRTTASDLYLANYAAQMRQHRELSAAEVRAQNYHESNEICDPHHGCSTVSEETAKQTREKEMTGSRAEESSGSIPMIPVWG